MAFEPDLENIRWDEEDESEPTVTHREDPQGDQPEETEDHGRGLIRVYVQDTWAPIIPYRVGQEGSDRGKTIKAPQKFGVSNLYVMPCNHHREPMQTIITDAYAWQFSVKQNKWLGRLEVCPVCWEPLRVLDPSRDEMFDRWEAFNMGQEYTKIFAQWQSGIRKANREKWEAWAKKKGVLKKGNGE